MINFHHKPNESLFSLQQRWSFLNDDVLLEILLRLPAKTLIRFKSVSKQWFSIISCHQFGLLHTLRHPKPQPSLLLQSYADQFYYFDPIVNCEKLIPFTFTISNYIIWSWCNGLLLVQSHYVQKEYFVYNPTTTQSRKITLTKSDEYTHIVGLHLAFDPSKSLHYKIVCVRMPCWDYTRCQIEVYSSESRTWELCLGPLELSRDVRFDSGVCCNNVIYWEWYNASYMFFDIDRKVIGSLIYPEAPQPGLSHWGVSRLRESNGYVYHIMILPDTSLAIFELQEHSFQWLLKYHDGFDMFELRGRFDILSLDRGHNGERYTLLIDMPGKIVTYRTLDKSYVELDLKAQSFYQEGALLFGYQYVYKFGESLVPV